MDSLVSSEVSLAVEAFPTIYITVCFLFHMDPLMTMQCRLMNECFVTDITCVWFLSCMDPLVKTEASTLHEACSLRFSFLCVFSAGHQTEVQLFSHTLHWYCVNSTLPSSKIWLVGPPWWRSG